MKGISEPYDDLLPVDDYSKFLLAVASFENLSPQEQYKLKRQIAFLHSKIENLEHENKKLTADNRFLFMARNKCLGDVCDLEAKKERLEELLQERSATTPSYVPAGAFQHYNGLD